MPEIARFFGIVVRMFAEPGSVHHRPHFHVWYQGWSAVSRDFPLSKSIHCARMTAMERAHPIHRVTGFAIVAPYTLEVLFDDGLSRVIDLAPVLKGELFGPLRDHKVFDQVALDREVHTLVWPNGADFDPATLHDWPDVADEMRAMASRWR